MSDTTWPPPPPSSASIPPPPPPAKRRSRVGRVIVLVGAAVFLVGTGLSVLGSTAAKHDNQQSTTASSSNLESPRANPSVSSSSSFDYQQGAVDVCQTDLTPNTNNHGDDVTTGGQIVTFDPDPTVTREGLAFTVSGSATVGPNRTTYSCVVVLQGDRLDVSRSAFGG